MNSHPERSLGARRADPPPTEQRYCPECSRPLAEHSVHQAPGEGYVLHNDALGTTCWTTVGRVTEDMLRTLLRPGVLPPIARRERGQP